MESTNLSLARGDTDAAIKLCNEVIRQGMGAILRWMVEVLLMESVLFLSTPCCRAIRDAGNGVRGHR